jgi:myo-inositol 2-dehydrogenase / D-chiro-inositol 1-dehydrogenase
MQATRRDALKAGAAVAATVATTGLASAHANGSDKIKVGLIGCGGRGSGAIRDSLAADPATVFWAAGDVFEGKAANTIKSVADGDKSRVDAEGRAFSGLDAYEKVLASGVDLVILATPPGFRPYHLEAAVKAKKHIFCEKPVAVDAPGIRKCLEVAEQAKKDKLAIVCGTQRRHQVGYLKSMELIHGGDIGKIVSARCSWNGSEPWFNARKPGQSDTEYQLSNWYHFMWLCGDHIVEQQVHNLDVINWAMKGHPVKAVGQGGRIGRRAGKPEDVGHIYDLFAIEFEYPGGVPMYSYCSHVPGTTSDVSEMVIGEKGVVKMEDGRWTLNGKSIHTNERGKSDPRYVTEHVDLIKSIRDGKPAAELTACAESTFTAILGRTAVYTGQVVKWDDLLKTGTSSMPEKLDLKGSLAVSPVPRPGRKA